MPLKRRTQKMFDSVTERIKNQTQGGLKVNPETGVRYEEPLEEKHPGLTIGLMAAQPGTILEKVLAPSVYKGMVKSIGEGNLSEALMASVAPVKGVSLTRVPESAWAEMLHEEAIAEAGALKNGTLGSSKFRPMPSKPITEAEKLGIPKSERANPKSLEDSQYWGYKQWNNRYNAAIESGNIEEAQRLRDLHFKTKAPKAPQYNFYHGTFNKEQPFYIFEPQNNNELFFHFSPYKDTAEKFMGMVKTRNEKGRLITAKLNIQHPTTVIDSGWWNWYRIPEANPRISKTLKMDGPTAGQYYSDLLLKSPSVSEANGKMMDMLGNDALMYKNYTEDAGRISVAIPRPSQIKLADPITYDNTGKVIPIVKRDNFRNPDIRHKHGGKLKRK